MSLIRWLLDLIRPQSDADDAVASVLRRSSKPPTASADNLARARQRFMAATCRRARVLVQEQRQRHRDDVGRPEP